MGGAEGIVNGMDTEEWNPQSDKYLPIKYNRGTVFEGKAAAKAALQAEAGLPVDPSAPLFGYIGRLEEQKGVDILLAVRPFGDAAAAAAAAVTAAATAAALGLLLLLLELLLLF